MHSYVCTYVDDYNQTRGKKLQLVGVADFGQNCWVFQLNTEPFQIAGHHNDKKIMSFFSKLVTF